MVDFINICVFIYTYAVIFTEEEDKKFKTYTGVMTSFICVIYFFRICLIGRAIRLECFPPTIQSIRKARAITSLLLILFFIIALFDTITFGAIAEIILEAVFTVAIFYEASKAEEDVHPFVAYTRP